MQVRTSFGDQVSYFVRVPDLDLVSGYFGSGSHGPYHHIENVYVKEAVQRHGIATEVHSRQVSWGSQVGVKRLRLRANRSELDRGYLAWPILGYDGPIPEEILAELPERLQKLTTVQQLIADEEGQDWWHNVGDTVDLSFDLAPGSDQRQNWATYWTEEDGGTISGRTTSKAVYSTRTRKYPNGLRLHSRRNRGRLRDPALTIARDKRKAAEKRPRRQSKTQANLVGNPPEIPPVRISAMSSTTIVNTEGIDRILAKVRALESIDFEPLMQEWRAVLKEDNDANLGIDGFGIPMIAVTYRPDENAGSGQTDLDPNKRLTNNNLTSTATTAAWTAHRSRRAAPTAGSRRTSRPSGRIPSPASGPRWPTGMTSSPWTASKSSPSTVTRPTTTPACRSATCSTSGRVRWSVPAMLSPRSFKAS